MIDCYLNLKGPPHDPLWGGRADPQSTEGLAALLRLAAPVLAARDLGSRPSTAQEAGHMRSPRLSSPVGRKHQNGGSPAKLLPQHGGGAAAEGAAAAAVELNRGGSRDGPTSSGSGFWANETDTLVAGDAALSGILTDLMEAGSGRRQEVASPRLCSLGIERLKDRPVVESLSMMC